MKNTYKGLTIVLGLAVVIMVAQILVGQAPAQGGGGAPGQEPGAAGGRGGIINPDTGAADGKIPYNAEWEAKAADTTKNHMYDEPYAHCLPAGVPTNFGIQMGFQAVQDKNSIVYAWDTAGATRIIYTDDRKHVPANMRLYQGDSVGHWEGDTLVVDTTSQAAGWWDANGAVHSDQVHVVENN